MDRRVNLPTLPPGTSRADALEAAIRTCLLRPLGTPIEPSTLLELAQRDAVQVARANDIGLSLVDPTLFQFVLGPAHTSGLPITLEIRFCEAGPLFTHRWISLSRHTEALPSDRLDPEQCAITGTVVDSLEFLGWHRMDETECSEPRGGTPLGELLFPDHSKVS
jgi:hypothetical protein